MWSGIHVPWRGAIGLKPREIDELALLLYAGALQRDEARSAALAGCLLVQACILAGVKEGLQDEGGSHLIDHAAMLLPGMAGLIENPMCFASGKPLVPQVDGQAGERAEVCGQGVRFGGAWAQVAGEMQGIADYDGCHAEAPRQTRQRTQVVPWVAFSLQCEDGLCRQAEFVRHGDADALCTNVEGEIAGLLDGVQRSAPGL